MEELSIKQLRAALAAANVPTAGCIERSDLVELYQANAAHVAAAARSAAALAEGARIFEAHQRPGAPGFRLHRQGPIEVEPRRGHTGDL